MGSGDGHLRIHVPVKLKPGTRTKYLKAARKVVEATREKEKGALYYNVHLRNGQGDEDMVYWIEEWASQEVFDAHMETQHVKDFLKEIKELMDCELEIISFKAVDFDKL